MSKQHDGGPAFPVANVGHGMSLRDYFAAQAMQSLLQNSFDFEKEQLASDVSVKDLGMSIRTVNCLLAENINNIGDLIKRTENELLKTPLLGRISINEIKRTLHANGMRLNGGNYKLSKSDLVNMGIADRSYKMADAMLAARNAKEGA